MRAITVYHRDGRGKITYAVFETTEQLFEMNPNAIVKTNLADAEAGDYIVSDNGWVVPLLKTTYLEDKYVRNSNKSKFRKRIWRYKVFIFPKYRKCVRIENLFKAPFNYTPRDLVNFASDGVRNRMYELSARKIRWAQLVVNGYYLDMATRVVYPHVSNQNNLIKSLLLNDKLQDFIHQNMGLSYQQKLEQYGITTDAVLDNIAYLLKDRSIVGRLKIWALETTRALLNIG